MKSAYELAMERLNKTTPVAQLSSAQKEQIAELESRYKARIAQSEIALAAEIASADASGDEMRGAELRQQLAGERQKLQSELEEKKVAIHRQAGTK